MTSTAIILAAGFGTRMKSALPKALHPIAGRPMLRHLLESCEAVFDRIVVVIGPDMDAVAKIAAPHTVVVQHERLGTAHAALQAAEYFSDGEVAVLYADNPLIAPATLIRLLDRRAGTDIGLALLAMRPADPARYGRVVANGGLVERIIEWAEADIVEREIGLCNAGVLCGGAAAMRRWLGAVRNDNAKGEYYLTDLVALARAEGEHVAAVEAPEAELRGINSRVELAEAEATVQSWLRVAAMEAGVTMTSPDSVFLCADTTFEQDVSIGPDVVFGPGVTVRTGAVIKSFCHIEGAEIGPGAIIGPFARLRPGTRIGADGAKASHLSYLGDSAIGAGTNIGAGTITCNYDGYDKHRTNIGENVFIGSDSVLVAPITIGDGAFVTAGSVVTRDVAPNAMAFGRAQQIDKPGRAAEFHALHRKQKG